MFNVAHNIQVHGFFFPPKLLIILSIFGVIVSNYIIMRILYFTKDPSVFAFVFSMLMLISSMAVFQSAWRVCKAQRALRQLMQRVSL